MTTPNDRAMRKAADQVAIDRMGEELNHAQARRQQLAAKVFATHEEVVRLARRAAAIRQEYDATLQEWQREKTEYKRLKGRLDQGLQIEEGLRYRLERYKAGGAL